MRAVLVCMLMLGVACAPTGSRSPREDALHTCNFEDVFDGDYVLMDGLESVTVDGESRPGFVVALGFAGPELTAFGCSAQGWFQERVLVRFVQEGGGEPELVGMVFYDTLTSDVRSSSADDVRIDQYDLTSSTAGGALRLAIATDGVAVDWDLSWRSSDQVETDPFEDW